jgi:hypothetical protein
MNRMYFALPTVLVFSLPSLSHADTTDAPITRAQVRAELVAAEHAGQFPRVYPNYPDSVPNASTRYVLARAAAKATLDSSYGPEMGDHVDSGSSAAPVRAAGE